MVQTTLTKRKAVASTAPRKRPRIASSPQIDVAEAKDLLASVLADQDAYKDDDDPDSVGNQLLTIAAYARYLEDSVASGDSADAAVPAPKSKEELAAAAKLVRAAAAKGIKSQMKWKPSCKTGSSKWSYDGLCQDPEVFGYLLGLGGPPKFKMKKFTSDEFEAQIGRIVASARYDSMYITSDVNVRYNPETGEFKFTGSYGAPR